MCDETPFRHAFPVPCELHPAAMTSGMLGRSHDLPPLCQIVELYIQATGERMMVVLEGNGLEWRAKMTLTFPYLTS